jgi:hypothetical protein
VVAKENPLDPSFNHYPRLYLFHILVSIYGKIITDSSLIQQ